MSYGQSDPYAAPYAGSQLAAYADTWERTVFIRRTYTHLALAVGLFAGIEALFFLLLPAEQLTRLAMTLTSGYNWLIVLGAFMAVSWIADRWARSSTSLAMQYAGLALYAIGEAVIFVPLLWFAQLQGQAAGQNIIGTAALMTGIVFGGLTALVFVTRADFSWLGRFLWLGGLVAFGLIAASILFGFGLGVLFVAAMIALASGYIVYHTSNVLHHYRTDQYVAAALALFAAVALVFWYILQLFMSRD